MELWAREERESLTSTRDAAEVGREGAAGLGGGRARQTPSRHCLGTRAVGTADGAQQGGQHLRVGPSGHPSPSASLHASWSQRTLERRRRGTRRGEAEAEGWREVAEESKGEEGGGGERAAVSAAGPEHQGTKLAVPRVPCLLHSAAPGHGQQGPSVDTGGLCAPLTAVNLPLPSSETSGPGAPSRASSPDS